MKVVLHHTASPGFRQALHRQAGDEFQLAIVDLDDTSKLAHEMKDAEVLLHVLAPVCAKDMDAAPKLRLIQKIGVGLDTIDLEAARARSISVANMPGTNSQAVAEMTLLLMLGALRRVTYFDSQMRKGNGWSLSPESFDGLGEVCGRTVGLVGYGQVPQRLAPALRAMGAKVIYTNLAANKSSPEGWCDLDTLFAEADVISLHVPLSPQTKHMISRKALAKTKKGVVIINTARGGLIDEIALLEGLKSGHVAAAGLDVVDQEPAPADHPFYGLENVVLMPHIAWLTPETLERSLKVAFENCRRIQSNQTLMFQVVPSPV